MMVPKPNGGTFVRSYPGHASFAADARHDFRRFAEQCGLSATEIADITIAVGEVFASALESRIQRRHGFLMVAKVLDDRVEIDISDSAARFAKPATVRDPDREALAPRGFGMTVLNRVVDAVTFSEGGTRVQLMKRIEPKPS